MQRLETRSKQPTQVYRKKSLEVVRKVDAAMILDEKDLLSKARGLLKPDTLIIHDSMHARMCPK